MSVSMRVCAFSGCGKSFPFSVPHDYCSPRCRVLGGGHRSPGFVRPTVFDESLGGIGIRLLPGEPIDAALRRFKKIVEKANVTFDARRHEAFTPKPQARRLKSAQARKRQQRAAGRGSVGFLR